MSITETIVLGVVSGVLTSFFLFLFSQFVRQIGIPWYQQLIYKGIDISGDWKTEVTNPSGNTQSLQVSLVQKGTNISGIMTISKLIQESNTTEVKTYSVEGIIRDRFVSMIGENTSRKNLGTHIELLEIVGDGGWMQGKRTWYSVTQKAICSENVLWHR